MTQPAATTRIQFTARSPVELEEGLILAPGTYTGTVTRLGVPVFDGTVSWVNPVYKLELTSAELTAMGRTPKGLVFVEFDVTGLVRARKLTPIED
jgi:hypothetical protein